jgi:hypothetical protein
VSLGARFALGRFGKAALYRNVAVRPAATFIAFVGLFWFIERLGLVPGG